MPEQEFPPYVGITDVTTQSHDQMLVEAFMEGQHSIMADEPQGFDIGDPPDLVGQSRGWTPVHYQLAALSMCTSITITVVARDQGFQYRNLRTAVRSLIDIRGFFFDLHLQPKFEQVNYDLWLDTDADDDAIRALADESDRRCPQLGLFHLAGIPMRIRWLREGSGECVYEQRFHLDGDEEPEARLRREAAELAAAEG
ncbi:MAG: OsmC family protein [Actinobacteria bacterium]|nr:OsmC family protein [Actinomycetota bacterium]